MIISLQGATIKVPEHTTCRRRGTGLAIRPQRIARYEPMHLLIGSTGLKLYGEGEWLDRKHGIRARRRWHKVNIPVDAESGKIIAHDLNGDEIGDDTVLQDLLNQVEGPIAAVIADGVYDGQPVCDAVAARHPEADIIIPSRSTAFPNEVGTGQRDRHIKLIADQSRRDGKREPIMAAVASSIRPYAATDGRRLEPSHQDPGEPADRSKVRVQYPPQIDQPQHINLCQNKIKSAQQRAATVQFHFMQ